MPPASRITDMHVCPMVTGIVPHVGGPILPPGVPQVLIGFLPAATVTNMCTCVGPPDIIVKGSAGVLINYLPAARMGDTTAHGGTIVLGEPTVMIGETGSGGAGGAGAGAVAAGTAASGVMNPSPQEDTPINENASKYSTGNAGSGQGGTSSSPATPPPVSSNKSSAPASNTSGSAPAKSDNQQQPQKKQLTPEEIFNAPNDGPPIQRIVPGTNGKIAVIGRKMDGGVRKIAAALQKAGGDTELFDPPVCPQEAIDEFMEVANKAKADYEAGLRAEKYLTAEECKATKLYKENCAWAKKLKDDGYTIADMGNPFNQDASAFYDAEKDALQAMDWVNRP